MEQGCLSTKDMQLLKKIGIYTFYFTDVDYAIERIRKKYKVVISSMAIMLRHRVHYRMSIAYPVPNAPYMNSIPNNTSWTPNIYEAKRKAIRIAAKWILAHKCKKVSIKSAKK